MSKRASTPSTAASSASGSAGSLYSSECASVAERDSLLPADAEYLDSQFFLSKKRGHEFKFMKANDTVQSTFFLVTARWIFQWEEFVRGGAVPGPVDNTSLLDQWGCLQKSSDYLALNLLQWLFLLRQYGGGPAVRKLNIEDGHIKCLHEPKRDRTSNRHISAVTEQSQRQARLLLGIGAYGPTPGHFALVTSQIETELRSEAEFIDMVQDARLDELRIIMGRKEGGDFDAVFAKMNDPKKAELCKSRLTDLKYFLSPSGPSSASSLVASLIGAAHSHSAESVDKGFELLAKQQQVLGEFVTTLKRKLEPSERVAPSPFKVARPNFGLMECEGLDF